MVSTNATRSRPSPIGVRDASAPLEVANVPVGTSRVTPNTALRSGSSKHGKQRRASVAWNCVVAMVWAAPSGPWRVLR